MKKSTKEGIFNKRFEIRPYKINFMQMNSVVDRRSKDMSILRKFYLKIIEDISNK